MTDEKPTPPRSDSHIDPLGRQIRLPDFTWFGHIVKGHPEMALRRAQCAIALASPETIRFSQSDVDCRLYYSPDGEGWWVCVVADVRQGFVKTAYRSKRIKPGVAEWSRPNPSKA